MVQFVVDTICPVTEPDKGASRVLYISDETVSGLIRPNDPRCIRLRVIHQ